VFIMVVLLAIAFIVLLLQQFLGFNGNEWYVWWRHRL